MTRIGQLFHDALAPTLTPTIAAREAQGRGHLQRMRVIRMYALFVGVTLGACSPATPDPLSATDAARWLKKACGVELSAPLQLQRSRLVKASAAQGWTTWVDGTVTLPEAEVPKVLDTLQHDTGLNLRGASNTHYSFQAPDGRPQERECELDTTTRQLYFLYSE